MELVDMVTRIIKDLAFCAGCKHPECSNSQAWCKAKAILAAIEASGEYVRMGKEVKLPQGEFPCSACPYFTKCEYDPQRDDYCPKNTLEHHLTGNEVKRLHEAK